MILYTHIHVTLQFSIPTYYKNKNDSKITIWKNNVWRRTNAAMHKKSHNIM